MRVLSVFRKSLREQLRELWLVALVLSLAPFFILLYAMVFGEGMYTYKLIVVNQDRGARLSDGSELALGAELVKALESMKNASGGDALVVSQEQTRADADAKLGQAKAHALLQIGPRFSEAMAAARAGQEVLQPAQIVYSGDMGNTSYLIAAVLAVTTVETFMEEVLGAKGPVSLVEEPLGKTGARSEFDVYIPGLFIFAVILLIFPTCMALARENDAGTLRRLQLTKMSSFDLLAGLSLLQVLIAVLGMIIAFATAVAVGFESQGPLWLALLVTAVASFSCIGVGLLVACFSRSVTEAFLLGNFPMILLMFFSGSMFPIPKVVLFELGGVQVGLWDVLPTTHAVSALNKVMGIGLGVGDVMYELVSLALLSGLFFWIGVVLFKRRRMAAA